MLKIVLENIETISAWGAIKPTMLNTSPFQGSVKKKQSREDLTADTTDNDAVKLWRVRTTLVAPTSAE